MQVNLGDAIAELAVTGAEALNWSLGVVVSFTIFDRLAAILDRSGVLPERQAQRFSRVVPAVLGRRGRGRRPRSSSAA